MSYTLTVSAGPERAIVLNLSGCLTIRNCASLHKDLLEFTKVQQAVHLVINEVEELDITFIQLLLALGHYFEVQHNPFELQLDLRPELIKQLHQAGITKTLNINPS